MITKIKEVGSVYKADNGKMYFLTETNWYEINRYGITTSADFQELQEALQRKGETEML